MLTLKSDTECKYVAQMNTWDFHYFRNDFSWSCIITAEEMSPTEWSACLTWLFSVSLWMFALNGQIAGCGSLLAWFRSTRGVSLLWGLCEALWGSLLVSGCMFPIGCFCWTKTQWESGLFKEAASLLCSLQKISVWCWLHHISLMKHFYSDEIISYWWGHFV